MMVLGSDKDRVATYSFPGNRNITTASQKRRRGKHWSRLMMGETRGQETLPEDAQDCWKEMCQGLQVLPNVLGPYKEK